MKNIKRIFGVAILMSIVTTFSLSCSLSPTQEQMYYHFISGLYHHASQQDVKAETVKKMVEEQNKQFEIIGIQVKDNDAGKDIKQGTEPKELKKRFPVSKK